MLTAAPVTVMGERVDHQHKADTSTAAASDEDREEVLRLARRISDALHVRQRPRHENVRPGPAALLRLPYSDGATEIDLDATFPRLVENPFPNTADFVVVEHRKVRRDIALVVDVSGSMRGERVRTAVAAVAALATVLRADRIAVAAFGQDAEVLSTLSQQLSPVQLVVRLLDRRVRGLTNLALGLEVGRELLTHPRTHDRRVVLLTDAIHNAGPDPRLVAARLPRVDVLLDATAHHDAELARELAAEGHGVMVPLRSHRDVHAALRTIFAR